MARRPNYKFDRMEREKAKAAKKAAKLKIKQEKAAESATETVTEEMDSAPAVDQNPEQ